MTIDQALIDKVVAQVLLLLNGQTIAKDARNVVMLFCGARAGTQAGLDGIRRLSTSQHTLSVMRTEAARNIIPEAKLREAGAKDLIISDHRTDIAGLVNRSDILLVPTLTTRMAGHLALGLMESPAAMFILRMLLAGKPVIAIKDAADPNGRVAEKVYGGKAGAAPALRAKLEGNLAMLSSFGIELVVEGDFLAAMERQLIDGNKITTLANGSSTMSHIAAPMGAGRSSISLSGIVTDRDLSGCIPGSVVPCAAGTRFTAQAQDTIRRLRLTLEYA